MIFYFLFKKKQQNFSDLNTLSKTSDINAEEEEEASSSSSPKSDDNNNLQKSKSDEFKLLTAVDDEIILNDDENEENKEELVPTKETAKITSNNVNILNLSSESTISSSSSSSSSSSKVKSDEIKIIETKTKDESVCSDSHVSLDSLSKRVQTLVGPINLDLEQPAPQPLDLKSTQKPSSGSIYSQIIQNNGKLPDTLTTKSKFDYSSIQKDLDSIQNNLKNQKTEEAANNKENKEPKQQNTFKTNVMKKSSYLDFETPKSKLNEKSENYYAKLGRDLLFETPMRQTNDSSSSYLLNDHKSHQVYSATSATRLDTPSNNLSYNTFFGKVYTDYHSSTMCHDKLSQNFRKSDNYDEDLRLSFKKNASTSPIKFTQLSPSNSLAHGQTTTTKYHLNKSPIRNSKSAFDDDPEVILSRAKQQQQTTCASVAKQRSLNIYNDHSGDATSLFTNSTYHHQPNNFNTFDRVNSKLLTQLRDVVTRSPTYNDYDNSFLQKMRQSDLESFKQPAPPASVTSPANNSINSNSALTTVTATFPSTKLNAQSTKLDLTNTSGPSETYESTHTGSDDARAPRLPTYAYGSRDDQPKGSKGIYEKQQQQQQQLNLQKSSESFGFSKESAAATEQTQNSVLDPDYLRQVDKNVKKLLKKNVDKPKQFENVRKKVNAVAWDIDAEGGEEKEMAKENDTSNDDDLIVSHPYLPLRDVPMNNVAKKLQHELELEGELNRRLPKDLQKMWENLQIKQKSNEKLTNNDVQALEKLEKIFKNPINGLIDLENQQQRQQPVSTTSSISVSKKVDSKSVQVESEEINNKLPLTQQQQLNSASTQTSFIIEPKRARRESNENDGKSDADKQKKLKIQALIRKQKQEHEERLKMLEKLAKLERLQSEKMKQILLLNHNDTITSSIMADSYFQDVAESTISSQTNDDLTLTATDNECTFNELIQEKEAHLEKLDQKYKKKLQQRQQNQDVKKSSYVQVLNLKNTSVYEPPEGFYVVKEKKVDSKQQPPQAQQQQEASVQQPKIKKQTNDIFVTIPTGGGGNFTVSNNNTQNSKSVKNPPPKPTAWFQPVTIVSETTREPLLKHKKPQNKVNSSSNIISNDRGLSPPSMKQQRSSYSPIHSVGNSSETLFKTSTNFEKDEDYEKPKRGLKKMTLQQAFEMFNFDKISRSRKRLKEIKLRAEERRHEEQFKRERIHLGIDSDANSVAQRHIKHRNLILKHHPLSENLFLAQRRAMTSEQIKEQTNKIYKHLPEVKEKEKRVKVQEEKKLNRLKSSIYNRVSFPFFKFV